MRPGYITPFQLPGVFEQLILLQGSFCRYVAVGVMTVKESGPLSEKVNFWFPLRPFTVLFIASTEQSRRAPRSLVSLEMRLALSLGSGLLSLRVECNPRHSHSSREG